MPVLVPQSILYAGTTRAAAAQEPAVAISNAALNSVPLPTEFVRVNNTFMYLPKSLVFVLYELEVAPEIFAYVPPAVEAIDH